MNQPMRIMLMALMVLHILWPANAWAGNAANAQPHQPHVSEHGPENDKDAAKIKLLVDRQRRAWVTQDFAIAAADWLPEGELISPGGHVAANQMQQAISGYFEKFRDLRVTVKSVFVSADGTKAAIEWDWDVTRRRDGARGITHDAIIVDLAGGKIASWREYFDFAHSVDADP